MKPAVIDSPETLDCHGGHVLPSVRETWDGDIDHRVIDQECDGRAAFSDISDHIRALADDGHSGPVNVSWGAGNSRNPIRWSLTQYIRDVGSYDKTHPQYHYDKTGGIVVYAAGNDGSDEGVSSSAAGLFSIAAGAFNTGEGNPYEFSNSFQGLLVDYYADGKSPGGWRGTSFAAPRVAGALATLMDRGLSLWEAKQALYIDSLPMSTNGQGDLALLNDGALEGRTQAAPIDASARVLAAYVVGMGRRPDQAGWTWWSEQARENGVDATLERLLAGAKESGDWQMHKAPTARRVQCHYHLFLGREADDAGMAWWLRRLAHGHYGGVEVDEENGFKTAKPGTWYQINWPAFTCAFVSAAGGERALPAFTDLF